MLKTCSIPDLVKRHQDMFPTEMCSKHTGRQNVYGDIVSVCDVCLPRTCVTCFRGRRETCIDIQGTRFEVCEECAHNRDHIAARIRTVWSGPSGIAEFLRCLHQDRRIKNVLLRTLLLAYDALQPLDDLCGHSLRSYAEYHKRHDVVMMIDEYSTWIDVM